MSLCDKLPVLWCSRLFVAAEVWFVEFDRHDAVHKVDEGFDVVQGFVVVAVANPGFEHDVLAFAIFQMFVIELRMVKANRMGEEGKAQALLDQFHTHVDVVYFDDGIRSCFKVSIPPFLKDIEEGWIGCVADVRHVRQFADFEFFFVEDTKWFFPKFDGMFAPVVVAADDGDRVFTL